jgi:two-component system response regulator HydG
MNDTLRILVVDDDPSMVKTLLDIFKVKGYEAEAAYSGPEALAKVAAGQFDCILSDIKMPKVNGVELYRAIRASQPDLPVVLMTAYSTDSLVKEGLKEGAIACLTKPLDINALLGFLSSLRKERSVVIVDDDPQFCKTLGDVLRSRGFAATQITDPRDVLEMVGADGQVVLLDMKLNSIGGLEVLRNIREQYPHLPVILVTGYRDEMASAIEAALKINAYTCLYKPFQIEELLRVLNEVRRRELGRVLE